jgi:anti-sigma B factor antagonist
MEISEQINHQGHVYYLTGRLDAHEVPRLKGQLESVQDTLVLDFAGVNFIDSTGLALLVSLYKRAQKTGVPYKIVNVQDQVRVIFEITQLQTILPIEIS